MKKETAFRLLVSYDAGLTYALDRTAGSPMELLDRMRELDETMLRWYVEDQDGNHCHDLPCAIHASILELMKALNKGVDQTGEKK